MRLVVNKMRSIIIILIFVLGITGFVEADDLYFKDGKVWYNCQVIGISGDYVKIRKINNDTSKEVIKLKIDLFEGMIKKDFIEEEFTLINSVTAEEIVKLKKMGALIQVHDIWKTSYLKPEDINVKTLYKEPQKDYTESINSWKYKNLNKPLFYTGLALSTFGVYNLINGFVIHINLGNSLLPQEYMKKQRNKCLFFGGLFTITGIIDIYWSFENIRISANNRNIGITYSF